MALPIEGPVKGKPAMIRFESAESTIHTWCQFNDCGEQPAIDELPDRTADGTKVIRKRFQPSTGSAEVVLIVIVGGGHTWPSQPPQAPFAGRSTRDIVANDLVWEFFQCHPIDHSAYVDSSNEETDSTLVIPREVSSDRSPRAASMMDARR